MVRVVGVVRVKTLISSRMIPGWDLFFREQPTKDDKEAAFFIMERTYTGEWSEVDEWVVRYGKAYLDDCIQRSKENLEARTMVEWGESFVPPLIGTPKGVSRE